MSRWGSRLIRLIPLLCLALIHPLRAWDPGPVQLLRDLAFDTYQRAKPRKQDVAESLVRVIDIDDESLAKHGQWPWPRTRPRRRRRKLLPRSRLRPRNRLG